MEDRASSRGELIPAAVAIKLLALVHPRKLLAATVRALRAIRPADRFEEIAALFIGVEVLKQLHQIHGECVSHG